MNWTQADADKAQERVKQLARMEKFSEAAKKRSEMPRAERKAKTALSVGTKPERGNGAAMAQPQAKKSKYGNKRVQIDGIWFDSILEGRRYRDLDLLKAAGDISGFEMQVVYHLRVNGIHICDYRADFVVRYPDGRTEVEDTKGVETPKFVLQKKLMLAIYGIKIVLIRSKK